MIFTRKYGGTVLAFHRDRVAMVLKPSVGEFGPVRDEKR